MTVIDFSTYATPHDAKATLRRVKPSIEAMRTWFQAQIMARGGVYICPEDNDQPEANLKIATIRLDGIEAIGIDEAAAQENYLRQAAQKASA